MTVFVLQHSHILFDDIEEVFLIGVYSTPTKAHEAIVRLSKHPGFCDTPEGFHVSEILVDKDQWSEGYVMLYPDGEKEE